MQEGVSVYMDLISIIIPCYNEEKCIPIFYERICEVMNSIKNTVCELIFVDDGSTDNTINVIKELHQKDLRINYLSFSRNFGKESAMLAGFKKSKGDFVAIIDVDLQDPPELLIDMYDYILSENYDCVASKRCSRKGEPPLRSFFANCFYYIINKISKTKIVPGARDFRLMNRSMVNAILEVSEYNRFSKGIFEWVGFKTKWLEFENIERAASKTKWSIWKLFLYSLDGIMAFSTVPLALSSILGIMFFGISIIMIIFIIIRQLFWGGSAFGWPSLVCTILFLSGIQLFTIGILGQYLSKTYLETKKRPPFIIRESNETTGKITERS